MAALRRQYSLLRSTLSPLRLLPPGSRATTSAADLLSPRSVDLNGWYRDIIVKSGVVDLSCPGGDMSLGRYGMEIWDEILYFVDTKIKESRHKKLHSTQYVELGNIEKEGSHAKGFSPEPAAAGIAYGIGLPFMGPTSFLEEGTKNVNKLFNEQIRSSLSLPVMVTQWVGTSELWTEMVPPFKYMWQEGYTAHATFEEAEKEALRMIDVYKQIAHELVAIPVIAGRKSRLETLGGALCTYTIEAMMGDKKPLQAGTSHHLGQSFSRVWKTQFNDINGDRQLVWQTSWAISNQIFGAIFMVHGDDAGLMLPPRIAPKQVVIVPIWYKSDEKKSVLEAATTVHNTLTEAGIRVVLDDGNQETPVWKFNFWEMKGVPLRLEIGPCDVTNKSVVVCRRDVPGKLGTEFRVSMEASTLVNYVKSRLEEIQDGLLQRAISFRDSNIVDVSSYAELKEAIAEGKWARGPWSASDAEELKVKKETSATLRCIPFEQPEDKKKKCLMTGKPAEEVAIFAKSC